MDLNIKYFKLPIGTLQHSFIALSISSTLAMPSYKVYTASLIYGINILLQMNPGKSSDFTISFLNYLTTSTAVLNV